MRTTDTDKDVDVAEGMDNTQQEDNGQMADVPTEQQPDTAGATIADICRIADIRPNTVGRGWGRAIQKGQVTRPFSVFLVPTDAEAASVPALREAMGKTAQPAKRVAVLPAKVVAVAQPRAVGATQPRVEVAKATEKAEGVAVQWLEKAAMIILPGAVTVVSIGLTLFGLNYFAQQPGLMLGAMFGLVLFSAMIVARNPMKGDTSEQALSTVFWMEFGAFFLHCFTFYAKLPHPSISPVWDWAIRAVLAAPCAGFASFLSFRAVVMVRNYNAEG